MTWGSAFLQGLLSKNKANAGQTFTLHTEKKVNTNMRKLKTENTQLYFVAFFQLLLTRPDRAYLLDMTHQCLFSKLRLMMTFKRKSIDLSLHTGINLSFLSSWFDPNQKVPKTVLDTAVLYLTTYWGLAGPGAYKTNFLKWASCFTQRLKYELHFFIVWQKKILCKVFGRLFWRL